jgi:hypothetical protein
MYGIVDFVLLGYVAESLGYLCLTFWDSVVVLPSSKQCLVLPWKTIRHHSPSEMGAALHKPTNLLLWGSDKCMYFVTENYKSGMNFSVKIGMFCTSRGIVVFWVWCHAVWSVVLISIGTCYFHVHNSRAGHTTLEPRKVSM